MTGTPPATRARNLLLTVHVAAAASVLGADLSIVALAIASIGGGGAPAMASAAHIVAAWLVAPLALVALASGIALGLSTQWGLFRHWWVVIKLALTAALTAVVFFVLVPRLGAIAAAAAPAVGLPMVAAPTIGSLLLFVTIALAVFKPGGRVRQLRHPA